MTDITPPALKTIIRYMYTGTVTEELDSDVLLEIVYGAESMD